MFELGDAIYVSIPVNGAPVLIPGICSGDEYLGNRVTKNGATVSTRFIPVISYHAVPATSAKSTGGKAFTYFKEQDQSVYFLRPRTENVPELDNLTSLEALREAVQTSKDALAVRLVTTGTTAAAGEEAVKPKAKWAQAPVAATA